MYERLVVSARLFVVQETTEGNVTRISLVDAPAETSQRHFERKSGGCALCTCDLPIKIKYSDVLILEQFMRVDGTVLPKQLTG